MRTVSAGGTIGLNAVAYKVDVDLAFQQVLVISTGKNTGDPVIITDLEGQILAEHTKPALGIRYVGNNQPPGTRPKARQTSPKS